MMLSAGKSIVRGNGPLEAEVIASSLLGIWWGRDLIDVDIEDVLGGAIVQEAGRRRTAESLALLRSMAAVAEGRLAIRAATASAALEQVGVSGPPWLDQLGRAEFLGCLRSWDITGDGVSVILRYAYDDQPQHVLSVLIDRNLGGIVKDAWATQNGDEVLARYREECAKSDEMMLEEIAPETARALLLDAFAVTDRALRHDPPVSDEARSHRALTLARAGTLPAADTRSDLYPEDQRFLGKGWAAERDRFLATPQVTALKRPRIVAGCVEAILDHGETYDDGRLLRVSPVKVEVLLSDWLPGWADLSKSQVDVMPDVLDLWCRHAASSTGLSPALLDECLNSLRRFTPTFKDQLREPPPEVFQLIRQHIDADDIWDRTEAVQRLAFALLAQPDGWSDLEPDTLDDDMRDLAARVHPDLDIEASADEAADFDPQLHLTMHSIISCQLWRDQPPEVWRTARRLLLGGYDQHEIHHMLASAALEPIRLTLIEKLPFDLDMYVDRLDALPGSWEAQRRPE